MRDKMKSTIRIPLGYLVRTSSGYCVFPMQELAMKFDTPMSAMIALCDYLCTKSWRDKIKVKDIHIDFIATTCCGDLLNDNELSVLLSDAVKRKQERN